MTLWQKSDNVDDWVIRFTVGDDHEWDNYLLPYDIRATLAHIRGLQTAGVLQAQEVAAITVALEELSAEVESGNVRVNVLDEDCHTVIEKHLTTRLGDVGQKVHAGRSRNDQVLAALRLYLRETVETTVGEAVELVEVLCSLADHKDDWLLPGYTHMRPAMPSTVGLWAAGYAELLTDDIRHLLAVAELANKSPLGTAAGFGVPHLSMAREQVASELGFEELQVNATSVQLSRGKNESRVADAYVQLSLSLNRIASDLIYFSSPDMGFATLPERFCTGSSVMPHKQNPDVLEIVRASFHRVAAEAGLLRTVSANLRSGYHRDLQLTKSAVMRVVAYVTDCVYAVRLVLSGVSFDREKMQQSITADMMSTATANSLVAQGVPFRKAYRETAGRLKSIDVPPAQEILAAYSVAGSPGRTDVSGIRRYLAQIKSSQSGRLIRDGGGHLESKKRNSPA